MAVVELLARVTHIPVTNASYLANRTLFRPRKFTKFIGMRFVVGEWFEYKPQACGIGLYSKLAIRVVF
jgi:hypothetical protein